MYTYTWHTWIFTIYTYVTCVSNTRHIHVYSQYTDMSHVCAHTHHIHVRTHDIHEYSSYTHTSQICVHTHHKLYFQHIFICHMYVHIHIMYISIHHIQICHIYVHIHLTHTNINNIIICHKYVHIHFTIYIYVTFMCTYTSCVCIFTINT